jgi:hypothetical protein
MDSSDIRHWLFRIHRSLSRGSNIETLGWPGDGGPRPEAASNEAASNVIFREVERTLTSFEHAMLGIDGVLAVGLNRKYGWQLAAVAGMAAVMPDWDGLSILVSAQLFDESHRVWGHNLLSCLVLGLLIGTCDYRWDLVTRVARPLVRLGRSEIPAAKLAVRHHFSLGGLAVWLVTSALATLSHLPADLVVSGTATLEDWKLKLWWPWSDAGYVFPMVRWGDAVITIVFVVGMFAMVRWRSQTQNISCCTLAGVIAYLVIRRLIGY